MATEVSQQKVFESRWGRHPCSFQTYQKLRRLYGYYLTALSSEASWTRWNNKYPHNRVIRKWKRDAQGRRCGCEIVGPRLEPTLVPIFNGKKDVKSWSGANLGTQVFTLNDHIYENYVRAKYPKASASDVVPLSMTETQIDEMLDTLDKWNAAR